MFLIPHRILTLFKPRSGRRIKKKKKEQAEICVYFYAEFWYIFCFVYPIRLIKLIFRPQNNIISVLRRWRCFLILVFVII